MPIVICQKPAYCHYRKDGYCNAPAISIVFAPHRGPREPYIACPIVIVPREDSQKEEQEGDE